MRNRIQVFIILLIATLFTPTSADFEDLFVVIQSVSTAPDQIGTKWRTVSLEGGAYLYIKGTGFSTRSASSNKVLVGDVECPVIEFMTTSTQIVCQVPPSPVARTVTLHVFIDDTRNDACKDCITYSYANTPELTYMVPNAANPGDQVDYYGRPRVASTLNVDYVKIGDHRCDVNEMNEFDALTFSNPDSDVVAPCNVPELEAGYYDVSQRNLGNTGFARRLRTLSTYRNGGSYDFVVVPRIDSINSNGGSSEGQILTVKGKGFSTTEQNEVKLGDTSCAVLSQSATEIQCELQPRSAPPTQGYHAGWKFELYKDKSMADVKAGTAGTPTISLSRLAAETPLNIEEKYGSKLYGYFRPPVTGNYKFYVSADDQAELYISKTPLVKTNLDKIVTIGSYTPYKHFFSSPTTSQVSDDVSLVADNYYYMELYHYEGIDADFATVGVLVPNSLNDVNVKPEVQSIKINCPADSEIWEFKLKNVASGTWRVRFDFSADGKKIDSTSYSSNLNYDTSAGSVDWEMYVNLGKIKTQTTKKMFKTDGTETLTASEATTFTYQVKFLNLRKNGMPLKIDATALRGTAAGLTPSAVSIQPASTPMKGSFTLIRGTKSTQIPYNVNLWTFEDKMRELGFKDPIRVVQIGEPELGSEWRVQFSGEDGGSIPDLTSQHTLTGCKGSISITVSKLQQASTDLFYESIPLDYLFTVEQKPQITVKSNGVTANCPNFNCDYDLKTTGLPELSSYTFTGSFISLTIGSVQAGAYPADKVRVFIGNTECQVVSYSDNLSPASIGAACSAPEAGDYTPKVHFEGLGYAKVAVGVPQVNIDAVVSFVAPSQVNPNGGTVLTISGQGFPVSLELAQKRGLDVKIGSSACTLNTVTSSQIICTTTPVAVIAPLTVALNGKTGTYNSLSLLSVVPTISTVSPNSVNPVLQTTITITGNNFDSTVGNTKIFLGTVSNPQIQECLPISSSSSQVVCKLLGAPTGTYNLYIKTSVGFTNSKSFEVKTVVNNITPSAGSTQGGTILTIQGGSFSNDKQQTLVFIGDENVMCDVISSSSTQVVCKTRAMDASYTSGTAQNVVVATRIVEESICENGGNPCSFTYSDALTPLVTGVSPVVVTPGDTLQLTGSGFDVTPAATPEVTIDGLSCVVASSSDTQITLTVPINAPANKIARLAVNIPGKGIAKFTVDNNITITPSISNTSPKVGSNSGTILTLTGAGFQKGVSVKVGPSPCVVQSVTPTTVVCKATTGGEIILSQGNFTTIKCLPTTCTLTQSSSQTPTATSISPQSPSSPSFSLTAQGTFTAGTPSITLISKNDNTVVYVGTVTSNSLSQIVASFTDVAAGAYSVQVASGANLAATSSVTINVPLSTISASPVQSSIAGGVTLSISGSGFFDNSNKDRNKVTVCGLPCQVTQSSGSSIQCQTPTFVNSAVKSTYPSLVSSSVLSGTTWSDAKNETNVFDLAFTTLYKSALASCEIGLDIGAGLLGEVSEVRFFPDPAITASTLKGTVIEGSNDNTTYTTVYTLDANTHDGWNTINLATSARYRYYRLRGATSTAKCALAELQYYGIVLSNNPSTNLNTLDCTAQVTVNGIVQETSTPVVNYKQSSTAVLTSISPEMGTTAGGTTLMLTGTGFVATPSQVKVYIDDVECAVQTATTTQITCLTGAAPSISNRRSSLESELKIQIIGQGSAITNNTKYFYIDRWSDISTWGGITPPREGESVSIPSGQTILLDLSPPKLKAIIIEGALIFDDANIDLKADYIIVRGGRFQIGTWEKPIQHKITVTLHGTKQSPQLPTFGNKVIANMGGILDIHGKPRSHTWTLLDRTANAGDTSIVIQGAVDWAAGEQIIIASTEHDHYQSESRTIATVTPNSPSTGLTTITFTDPFKFKHYAGIQTIGGVAFEMRAEVGLLTRNVVIQGDENSQKLLYGVHIMSHSPFGDDSSIGRISYTEVRQAGQAYNLGRYPIHFHMIGNVRESYVIGNAIHHTYNRAVTIHGVHFLKVQKNVAYWCMGHNIFIEDGIETHNVIEDNLVMNTIASTALLNTDQTPASFWITNPNNIWRRNHAAGSDRYGFWFDLRDHPEGPSATTSICPTGEKLGEFLDNQAHSCGRYALKIFHELIPRKYPCMTYEDPVANPPIQAEFKNFFGWKNMRNAVIGERLGAIKFKNIKAADNLRAGIEISDGNRSPPDTLLIEDAWIVGVTPDNGGDSLLYSEHEVRGLITPKVDFFLVKNVHFYNFGINMTAIETCSHCEHPAATDAGARTTFFEGISFNNVNRRVRFHVPYKEILVDKDGTLTDNTAGGKGVVTYYYDHLDVPGCRRDNAVYDGLVCDQRVTIRRVELYNPVPFASFEMQNLTIYRNQDNPQGVRGSIPYRSKNRKGWATPFVTGYSYNVSWTNRADFTQLSIEPSQVLRADDKTITLVFNHSEYRETFDVTKPVKKVAIANTTTLWDVTTADTKNCGDWYHDPEGKYLYVAFNGKQNDDNLTISAVKCRDNCPVVGAPTPKDNIIRLWSQASIWPSGQVPQDGEDVEIPGSWVIKLDVNTSKLGTLVIKGDLYFDNTKDDLVLTAEKIWVQGNLFIGNSSTQRYTKKAKILLTGTRQSESLIIGEAQDASNKVLAVTGNVTIYGALIDRHYVRLLAPANAKATTITVPSDVTWKVGDDIVLAPSERIYDEHESRKIVAINNGVITLDKPLTYYHFGAPTETKVTPFGTIDMRTEVGLLTRNIVIEGSDEDTWGGRLYVAEIYSQTDNWYYRGRVDIDGVEMRNVGQKNTYFAGITFDALTSKTNSASVVRRSVIRDSLAYNVRVYESDGITLEENVFYVGYKYQLTFEGTNKNIKFNKNLVIGSHSTKLASSTEASQYDYTAMFYGKEEFVNSQISENIFAGCIQSCLVGRGGNDCSSQNQGPFTFYNNVAHSGETGWLVPEPSNQCNRPTHFTGYKLEQGVATMFDSAQLKGSNFLITDTQVGISLNLGSPVDTTSISLTNSYVAGVSKTSYNSKGECSNLVGIFLATSPGSGKLIPPSKSSLPWYKVKSDHIWRSTFTVDNVTIENFDDSLVPGCSGNFAFKTNPFASDFSCISKLSKLTLNNVAAENKIYFTEADIGWIGVDDCGGYFCTGIKNVLVKDLDGSLVGEPANLFPSNPTIFEPNTCEFSVKQNAYICKQKSWGVLTFDSLDSDILTRLISPVNVTSDGFENILNSYMDHIWDGFYTGLKRRSRFHSIVQTQKAYKVAFTGTLPDGIRWQLQGASSTDSITVQYGYTKPQSVKVVNVDGTEIKPFLAKTEGDKKILDSHPCGTNIYSLDTRKITLKLTGEDNCRPSVTIINAIRATMRYAITVEEFFAQNGPATFVDMVAAILKINPASIRVVDIKIF